jgi:membrane protease YdiL (CAAX protease family)
MISDSPAAAPSLALERPADWRTAHGALLFFLVLAAQGLAFVAGWPLPFLIALLAYALIVLAVPSLRRSCAWMRVGRWDPVTVGGMVLLAVVSSLTLFGFHALFRPDVRPLVEAMPVAVLGGLMAAGVCFAVGNALLEEVIFRGILYDALEAQWGWRLAVVLSGLAFGALHVHGYPPGAVGGVLAGAYGLLLGLLRRQAGGLGAPWLAHIVADATIFVLLVREGLA